jgi:hypothetical protein
MCPGGTFATCASELWGESLLEPCVSQEARTVLRGVRPLTAQETTSEKVRLDNSVRATQQAERLGKPLGQKLADKSSASANQKRMTDQPGVLWGREEPVIKRRENQQVKLVETPDPKWDGGW